MLKTKSQVIFAALIIYVVYIAGFHYYFEPIDYDIFFYCAAALYAVSFSIWMAVQDYFSKSQANTLAKSSERHTAHKKTIKYKSDVSYAVLSLVVILLSLVPVTLILVSMLLNQREIYHISFIYQCLIFLVGYVITFITPYLYEIGKTHSIELDSRSNINNSGHKKGTSSSSEGVIDMSSWFNSWKEVGDVSPSPRVTEETMSAIRNAGAVFHKKSWVSQTSYNEAVKLVDKILIDSLGINAYKISPDAQLFNDLNATENDQKNIDNIIYERLKSDYNFITFCKKHDFKYIKYNISDATDRFIINVLEQLEYARYLQNPSDFPIPPTPPTTPIWDIVHTVGDWYDIVADAIHYHHHPASISADISFSRKKSWVSQKEYIEAVTMVNHFLVEILYVDKHELLPGLELIDNLATKEDMIDIDNLIYLSLKDEYDFRSFCEKTDFDRAIISTTTDKYTTNSIEQILYTLYLHNPSSFTHPPKEPTTPIWDIVHTAEDWYDIVADVIHYYYHPIYKTDSEE